MLFSCLFSPRGEERWVLFLLFCFVLNREDPKQRELEFLDFKVQSETEGGEGERELKRYLDFNVPSTAQGHIKRDKIILYYTGIKI